MVLTAVIKKIHIIQNFFIKCLSLELGLSKKSQQFGKYILVNTHKFLILITKET